MVSTASTATHSPYAVITPTRQEFKIGDRELLKLKQLQ